MKKLHFLSAALMALALTACNDDPTADPKPLGPSGEAAGKYMAINFRNADSRALADDAIDFEEGNGTEDENAIAPGQLHFLFFDNYGNPFMMTTGEISGTIKTDEDGAATNWVKPMKIDGNITNDNLNPSSGNSVLVLGSPDGVYEGKMPSRIMCIANVDDATMMQMYVNKSVDQLLDYDVSVNAVAPIHNTLTNNLGNFIMTSATYWEGADIICWADIDPQNICANSDLARKNPVQIYIERLASKVTVKSFPADPRVKDVTGEPMEFSYYYYDEDTKQVLQSTPKNIIMEPVGWGLNNKAKRIFGIKHLLHRDNNNTLYSPYFEDWRDFNRNGRSYWATTTSRSGFTQFIPDTISSPAGEVVYLFANTRDPFLHGDGVRGLDNVRGRVNFAWTDATKILFAAKPHIVEAGQTEYEADAPGDQLMSYGGEFYTPEALCRVLERNNPGTRIAFARITRTTDEDGHFKVNFYTLGAGAASFQGRDITDPKTGEVLEIDATPLQDSPTVQYWNGLAYYIINISNKIYATKGTNKGKEMFGLVRNASYVYDLTEYIGLGTPVPAPEAPTDVENPSESDTYVAAKLNILNWRLVANEHKLQ